MHAILMRLRQMMRPVFLKLYWTVMNLRHDHHVQAWNVGFGARIGRRAIIRAGVEVGSDVQLGDFSYISGPRSYVEAARIGKFCSIARQTTIGVGNHDHRLVTTHPFIDSAEFGGLAHTEVQTEQRSAPEIGNDVWIGMNATVMRGVIIGDGAVVAANSVVTKNVEPYTIVGGVPARFLKFRFPPEIAAVLKEIRWWDWPDEQLAACLEDFRDPVAFAEKFGKEA